MSKKSQSTETTDVTNVAEVFFAASLTDKEQFAAIDAYANKIAAGASVGEDNRADVSAGLNAIYNAQLSKIGITEEQAGNALAIALNQMPLITGQASQVIALERYNAAKAGATNGSVDNVSVTLDGLIANKQLGINGTTSVGATYASTASSTVVPTSSMAAAYTLEQQGRLQAAVAAAAASK